jgi:hypothetical protein
MGINIMFMMNGMAKSRVDGDGPLGGVAVRRGEGWSIRNHVWDRVSTLTESALYKQVCIL